MGSRSNQMRSIESNEGSLKRTSNESFESIDQLKKTRKTNELTVNERDYMIETAMKRLHVADDWRRAVARAANYISPVRFWEFVDRAMSKTSPAKYFIKCLNSEMFKR